MSPKTLKSYSGPHPLLVADIPELNRVFSAAFGDRYRRDGMIGVHVPPLNPLIWRYAIENAAEGAMVWRSDAEEIVGFNLCHMSGVEGWMGPIAVVPLSQGLGLGKAMVKEGVRFLKTNGARVIGLETMPRTMDNIGFYSGLGFVPGSMTITLSLDAELTSKPRIRQLSQLSCEQKTETLAACAILLRSIVHGYDYTREILLTDAMSLGDTLVLEKGGEVTGFALCHSVPLVEGRSKDELRVLKMVCKDVESCEKLLEQLSDYAKRTGARRLAVRVQSEYTDLYKMMIARRAKVRWTDLRMSESSSSQLILHGPIVLSNWEI